VLALACALLAVDAVLLVGCAGQGSGGGGGTLCARLGDDVFAVVEVGLLCALLLSPWLAAVVAAADALRASARARACAVPGGLGGFVGLAVYPAEYWMLGGREPLGWALAFVAARLARIGLLCSWAALTARARPRPSRPRAAACRSSWCASCTTRWRWRSSSRARFASSSSCASPLASRSRFFLRSVASTCGAGVRVVDRPRVRESNSILPRAVLPVMIRTTSRTAGHCTPGFRRSSCFMPAEKKIMTSGGLCTTRTQSGDVTVRVGTFPTA
jgi:hypothetical protein